MSIDLFLYIVAIVLLLLRSWVGPGKPDLGWVAAAVLVLTLAV